MSKWRVPPLLNSYLKALGKKMLQTLGKVSRNELGLRWKNDELFMVEFNYRLKRKTRKCWDNMMTSSE